MRVEVWYNVGWVDDNDNRVDHGVDCVKDPFRTYPNCRHRPAFLMSFGRRGDPIPDGDYNLIDSFDIELRDTDPLDFCEVVWRRMNAVNGDEVVCRIGVRSMSTNDIVVIDGRAFVARSFGFEEVTDEFCAEVPVGAA